MGDLQISKHKDLNESLYREENESMLMEEYEMEHAHKVDSYSDEDDSSFEPEQTSQVDIAIDNIKIHMPSNYKKALADGTQRTMDFASLDSAKLQTEFKENEDALHSLVSWDASLNKQQKELEAAQESAKTAAQINALQQRVINWSKDKNAYEKAKKEYTARNAEIKSTLESLVTTTINDATVLQETIGKVNQSNPGDLDEAQMKGWKLLIVFGLSKTANLKTIVESKALSAFSDEKWLKDLKQIMKKANEFQRSFQSVGDATVREQLGEGGADDSLGFSDAVTLSQELYKGFDSKSILKVAQWEHFSKAGGERVNAEFDTLLDKTLVNAMQKHTSSRRELMAAIQAEKIKATLQIKEIAEKYMKEADVNMPEEQKRQTAYYLAVKTAHGQNLDGLNALQERVLRLSKNNDTNYSELSPIYQSSSLTKVRTSKNDPESEWNHAQDKAAEKLSEDSKQKNFYRREPGDILNLYEETTANIMSGISLGKKLSSNAIVSHKESEQYKKATAHWNQDPFAELNTSLREFNDNITTLRSTADFGIQELDRRVKKCEDALRNNKKEKDANNKLSREQVRKMEGFIKKAPSLRKIYVGILQFTDSVEKGVRSPKLADIAKSLASKLSAFYKDPQESDAQKLNYCAGVLTNYKGFLDKAIPASARKEIDTAFAKQEQKITRHAMTRYQELKKSGKSVSSYNAIEKLMKSYFKASRTDINYIAYKPEERQMHEAEYQALKAGLERCFDDLLSKQEKASTAAAKARKRYTDTEGYGPRMELLREMSRYVSEYEHIKEQYAFRLGVGAM